jgi:hypothetical protein
MSHSSNHNGRSKKILHESVKMNRVARQLKGLERKTPCIYAIDATRQTFPHKINVIF